MVLNTLLGIAQILVGVALIAAILLQSKGEELGGVLGGSQSITSTRRGVDKVLFFLTVLLAILFFVLATVNVVLPSLATQ